MKTITNELALRPRFQLRLDKSKEEVLRSFENVQNTPFIASRIDDHVFLRFNRKESHLWTPQLHLEFVEESDLSCTIHGLFGPNPTLWTMFMFLHFGVATLFIGMGAWAYSNLSLHKPIGLQLAMMVLLIVLWFVLYFVGRAGKRKGRPQMEALDTFMKTVLKS